MANRVVGLDDHGEPYGPPSCVPELPEHPVDAAIHSTYRALRNIPAQHNLLREKLVLTTHAGLVMRLMQDPLIMAMIRERLKVPS